MLAQSTVMLDIANEFIPTIPKDANYQKRMAGFEQMKSGMRTIMSGAIESVGETHFYSKDSTLELVQGIITYLPGLRSVLTDQDRQDFARRVGRQIDAATDVEIKAALARLQTALAGT